MPTTTAHVSTRTLPSVRVQSVAAVLAIVGAVALPQAFHVAGAAIGVGAGLGQSLLPMHLPILLVGLLAGPFAGIATGAIAPVVSFALTGMPVAAMVPFMVIELAAYGLFAGLICGVDAPRPLASPLAWFGRLLVAQVAGRLVRAVAVVVAVSLLGSTTVTVASIWTSVAAGLPGLIIQWIAIPAIMTAVDARR